VAIRLRQGAPMLKCCTCKKIKEETEFSLKNKISGKKSSKCKQCQRIYVKEHYLNNREKYVRNGIAHKKNRRQEHKKIIDDIRSKGCCECGETHPAVLDFHHIDPSDKDFVIAKYSEYGLETLLKELNKCIVICSNCHRKMHWNEKQKNN
jgi:hypothetical protein